MFIYKLRFFLLFILVPVFCHSQEYLVYMTKGVISIKTENGLESVKPGMTLKADMILDIQPDSRLIILNESKKELYTLKAVALDKISNLITEKDNSIQQITESYLSFLKKKITDTDNNIDKNHKQTAGTAYRDADSLTLKKLVPQFTQSDSISEQAKK